MFKKLSRVRGGEGRGISYKLTSKQGSLNNTPPIHSTLLSSFTPPSKKTVHVNEGIGIGVAFNLVLLAIVRTSWPAFLSCQES